MRESFSGTALFLIVVFFVVIFTGYLCLSINQTRAFNTKNAIIRVIERYGVGVRETGWANDLSDKFHDDIHDELSNIGYRTVGDCGGNGWEGFNVNGIPDNTNSVFCVKYIASGNGDSTSPTKNLHYFKVKTFYHFNVPAFRMIFKLFIDGDTKPML